MAARLLLDAGHRHAAFVNFTGWGHYSAHDRRNGFAETMRAGGGSCEVIDRRTDLGPPAVALAADWLRRRHRRATAVAGYTQWEARPFLTAARHLGWRMPARLSVLTFGEHPWTWTDTMVTTLLLPERALGEAGVAMIVQRIAAPAIHQSASAIPFTLLAGETVGAPCRPGAGRADSSASAGGAPPSPARRHAAKTAQTTFAADAGAPSAGNNKPRAQGSIT